jgi:CMP-N-acetylneuraminic acid synthetase
MKVEALIPFWSNYKPTPDGFKSLPLVSIGGKSLISRTVELINSINLIDSVNIFASNDKVLGFIDKKAECNFIKREKFLDSAATSIEDIIESYLLKSKADVIVLLHPKSPFISPKTVEECLVKVLSSNFDSSFTATSLRKHSWFRGVPLNYDLSKDTPSLSEIDPLIIETSSVYVFTRDLFKEDRRRIGKNPYIKEIGHFEGFEIERNDDFNMAELIINAGLDKERS